MLLRFSILSVSHGYLVLMSNMMKTTKSRVSCHFRFVSESVYCKDFGGFIPNKLKTPKSRFSGNFASFPNNVCFAWIPQFCFQIFSKTRISCFSDMIFFNCTIPGFGVFFYFRILIPYFFKTLKSQFLGILLHFNIFSASHGFWCFDAKYV